MESSNSQAYQAAGVNIEQGYEAVKRMQRHVARTKREGVLSGLGGFGGTFSLKAFDYAHPVLISGTDGVGTKLLLAQQSGKLDSIGIDCVAMCVNDVLAQGAEPLFFLDYLAVGSNDPEKIEKIVAGVAEGCVLANAALIGGETAEMPDLYATDEFDLAGFCVGIADQESLIDGSKVGVNDVLIGLPSSGLHSNGFSLVRKVFFKDHDFDFNHQLADGSKLIDTLLKPTKIYVEEVLPLIKKGLVKGISHITGGGFYENIPRMFDQASLKAEITSHQWEVPMIFNEIQLLASISEDEMYHVFNMGIGLVLAISPSDVADVCSELPHAIILGKIAERHEGEEAVQFVLGEDNR